LDVVDDSAGTIVHEVVCPPRIAATNEVRNDQFGIGVNADPCPNIAPSFNLLLVAGILPLAAHERPNFITLDATNLEVSHVPVVVCGAGPTNVCKELDYGILGDPGHPNCGADRAAFNEAVDDSHSGFGVKATHTD
jgi:hypothetical protein